jgi:DNA-binding NarL/FixJ family response regulator
MKQSPVEEILQAIRSVLAGEIYLSNTIRVQLFQNGLTTNRLSNEPARKGIAALSDRELDIFRLIGQGNGTGQIAKILNLSISTVESHRTHIKEKLCLKSAPELFREAVLWQHSQNLET